MIQAVMLVLLGFLAASLLVLLIAPAYWSRAVRLTTDRIRRSLPVSEKEIRADKDLLRAEYAVKVHQLEKEIEQAKLNAHRQLIEINRRDAAIARFETDSANLTTDLEENRNARHVLEQTVNDRIPRVEARLREARQMLASRESEIADLNQSAQRQAHALAEAKAINEQQFAEIERLQSSLGARQSRDRRRFTELGVESEFALRTEVESLRGRTREQSSLIQRLQAQLISARSGGAGNGAAHGNGAAALAALSSEDVPSSQPRGDNAARQEIDRLKQELEAAQIAIVEAAAQHGGAEGVDFAREVATLKQRLRDQAEEIARLTNERDQAWGAAAPSKDNSATGNKLASRLDLMQNRADRDGQTIQRLRSELAAANERAARQAAYFMEEMRRFGTTPGHGTSGGDLPQRRRVTANVERAGANGARTGSDRTGTDRAGTGSAAGGSSAQALAGSDAKPTMQSASGGGLSTARRRSFESLTRALNSAGHASDETSAVEAPEAGTGSDLQPNADQAATEAGQTGRIDARAPEPAGGPVGQRSFELAPEDRVLPRGGDMAGSAVSDPEQRRKRLLDRLRSYEDS